MYLKVFILLIVSLITQTATAQETPAALSKWISSEPKQGKNKKLLNDYKSDSFFSPDSSRIIGYIKGYDTSLKFTSGIIYMENVITREDYPIVVPIQPDGRFEVYVKMLHPKQIGILFDRRYMIPVYVEPGQTVSVIFDWQQLLAKGEGGPNMKFNTILFGGPAAQINEELNSIELKKPDYNVLQQQAKTLAPDAFKEANQLSWNNARKNLDEQLSGKKYLEHTRVILRNQLDLEYAAFFFEFIMLRDYERKKDTANKIVAMRESESFYDFLYKNNFDRQELLLSSNFSTFINRLEFSQPYWAAKSRSYAEAVQKSLDTTTVKLPASVLRQMKAWQITDTLLQNKYAITPGFLYELCKARSLKFSFENTFKDKKDDGRIYLTQLANGMSHPFLLKQSEELFHRKYAGSGRTYTLPDNMSTAFFKSIINRHKGKMLFVDFWATTCGPCVGNIKQQQALRNKYKNNPDFDFVFITSEEESPLQSYEKFIAEQGLNNTYRVNSDAFLSLRELFKFNGIPRYVLIDKEGRVLDDDFEMYNFQSELPKLFPGKEWK